MCIIFFQWTQTFIESVVEFVSLIDFSNDFSCTRLVKMTSNKNQIHFAVSTQHEFILSTKEFF